MKLGDYLKREGIRQSDFARRIGVTDPYLSRLISGKQTPGGEVSWKIHKETNGAVTGADFFEQNNSPAVAATGT